MGTKGGSMTESQIADHAEEWRRQEIDDREFLEQQDFEANKRCGNCVWFRKGMCVCLESPYMGSKRLSRDWECDSWEFEDYD